MESIEYLQIPLTQLDYISVPFELDEWMRYTPAAASNGSAASRRRESRGGWDGNKQNEIYAVNIIHHQSENFIHRVCHDVVTVSIRCVPNEIESNRIIQSLTQTPNTFITQSIRDGIVHITTPSHVHNRAERNGVCEYMSEG